MLEIRRTRTQRNIAAAMLVFWLLALAASWANACVLQNRQTHVHPTAQLDGSETPSVSAGHAGAVPADDGDASSATAVCLEVCDALNHTSLQADQAVPADPALGLPIALAWVPEEPSQGPRSQAVAPPALRAAIPPRTLLSRLTL